MNGSKNYRVLFFVGGMVPTPDQRSVALNFGPSCSFRNVNHIKPEDSLEDCDAVYGDVPAVYAAAYPWAVGIVDYYAGKLGSRPMAAPEPVEEAPSSGAGDPATFDPFASVDPSRRKAADWTPQG